MGGPTSWTGLSAATQFDFDLAADAMERMPARPTSPGAAILAERAALEGQVAQLRAALADLLRISQVQILMTPERQEILDAAERALADTAPPTGA